MNGHINTEASVLSRLPVHTFQADFLFRNPLVFDVKWQWTQIVENLCTDRLDMSWVLEQEQRATMQTAQTVAFFQFFVIYLTFLFCVCLQTSSPAAVSGAVEGPHTSRTWLQPSHHPGPAQQSQSTHKGNGTTVAQSRCISHSMEKGNVVFKVYCCVLLQ